MIISPDSFLTDADGNYCWSVANVRTAWDSAQAKLKEESASDQFEAVAFMCGLPGAGKSTYLQSNSYNDKWLYFDATLCAPKRRKHLLKLIAHSNLKKICIYLQTPLEVCLKRNAKRSADRKVPEMIINQMNQSLRTPEKAEGFDQIITVKHVG